MAKKQEDNRDVFEKALDDDYRKEKANRGLGGAEIIAGTVLGAIAGGPLGRNASRLFRGKYSSGKYSAAGGAGFGLGVSGQHARNWVKEDREKRRDEIYKMRRK